MNNEIDSKLQIANIKPKMEVEVNYLSRIGLISYDFGIIMFVVNLLICLITMKNIKKNKILLIVSIVSVFFSNVFKNLRGFAGGLETNMQIKNNVDTMSIMIIGTFIIQLLIFIKLIINIKNKKKEENPKCQE